MTALADLVDTSASVGAVRGRLEKIRRLADLLGRLAPDEVAIATAFLTGSTRQGRMGVGGALIRAAHDVPPAPVATLTLHDVDAAFAELAAISGAGSTRARQDRLGRLFERATGDEQDFLIRLLFGELRQGAVEGVLLDAVARAASVPPARVRRAAMLAGNLAEVATAVLAGGETALDRFRVQVLRPVQPMLAETAEDIDSAVAALGTPSL